MNKVMLTGRIAKDLELKYTTNNNAVVSFNLAVRKTKEDADFISIVAYSKTAELLTQYCKKGSSIGVIGHLQTRYYDDKDGKRVYVTEVIASEVEFLQTKQQEEQKENLPF